MLKLTTLIMSAVTVTPTVTVIATDFTNNQLQSKLKNNVFKNDINLNQEEKNRSFPNDEVILNDIYQTRIHAGKVTYSEYEGQTFYTDKDLDQNIY